MGEALDIIARLGGVGALAGLLVVILGKKVTPRRSPAEIHDARVLELERGREQDRTDIEDATKVATDCRNDVRILTDYVHDLREHIATGRPPPPPDWPEGLRL